MFVRRPGAVKVFGYSSDDAKRSFTAALVALPIFAAHLFVEPKITLPHKSGSEIVLVHLVFYVLIWTVWPLVALLINRLWGRRERFFGYLTAFNWSMPIQASIWLLAHLLVSGLELKDPSARLTNVAAIAVVALYHIHIQRETLDVGIVGALVATMLNLFIFQILIGTHHVASFQLSES